MSKEYEVEEREEQTESPVETPVVDASSEAAAVDKPEITEPPKEDPIPGSAAAGEEGDAATEPPAPFVPDYKFKAGVYNKEKRELEQKEYEIDPRFREIMKDPESAELVRSLHHKAYGVESIKERYLESREVAQSLTQENTEIKASIDGLRQIYASAVQSGNYHKLDGFFKRLNIPQDVVLNYALEKAKLMEMNPEQRQIVQAKIDADQKAEELTQQQARLSQQNNSHAAQIKKMQFENVMGKPEVHALAQAFDERLGKTGSFSAAVQRVGELAWYQRGVDLTPEQAVNEVIEQYNLKGAPGTLPATPAASVVTEGAPAQKPIVQRTTKTIPNIQGRTTSPLKSKPRSIEDLRTLYKQKSAEQ